MPLSEAPFLLAQVNSEEVSAPGFFSAPTFFFALIGACILMIIIGAVSDHLANRNQDEDDEEEERDDGEDRVAKEAESHGDADEVPTEDAPVAETKAEKARAKREAKEQKKRNREQKKQAKAAAKRAKKSKGKGAAKKLEEDDDLEKLRVD